MVLSRFLIDFTIFVLFLQIVLCFFDIVVFNRINAFSYDFALLFLAYSILLAFGGFGKTHNVCVATCL